MEAVYQRPPCSCCPGTSQPAILQNLLSKHSPHSHTVTNLMPHLSPVYHSHNSKDRLLPTPRTNSTMREGSTGVPSPYSSAGSPSPPSPESSPGPNVSPVPESDFSRISQQYTHPTSTQSKLYQFLTGQRHPSQTSVPHPSAWQPHSRNSVPPQNTRIVPQGYSSNSNHHVSAHPSLPVPLEDSRNYTHTSPTSHRDSNMYANSRVYASECTSAKASAKRPLETTSDQQEPMDLTMKKQKCEETIEDQSVMNSSILRKILCGQKRSHNGISERADTPCSDDIPAGHSQTKVSSNTRVVLAKKNLFPVRARVSDWLVKMLQFVKSLPEFERLPHNDQLILLLNSWVKLLLLYMAETNFFFAVTPASNEKTDSEETTFQEVPTMKSVENLQGFIKKCQTMDLDEDEFHFLKKSALFQSGKL